MRGYDRTVHARWDEMEVVRYDRAGKWYLEPLIGDLPRQHVTINQAVEYALWAKANQNGQINLGLPGGEAFDRRVKAKA